VRGRSELPQFFEEVVEVVEVVRWLYERGYLRSDPTLARCTEERAAQQVPLSLGESHDPDSGDERIPLGPTVSSHPKSGSSRKTGPSVAALPALG
jgi:uncharacterized iron-regulated membrane protein